MTKSDQLNELGTALSKAQGKLKAAKKRGRNPFYNNSPYPTLEDAWEACRDILAENGLSVIQTLQDSKMETTLLHSSGQFISSSFDLLLDKRTMQSMGSAITYARRYALMAIVGLPAEDDDGNATVEKKSPAQKTSLTPNSPPSPSVTSKPPIKPITNSSKAPSTSTNPKPMATASKDDVGATINRLKNTYPGVPGKPMNLPYNDDAPFPENP